MVVQFVSYIFSINKALKTMNRHTTEIILSELAVILNHTNVPLTCYDTLLKDHSILWQLIHLEGEGSNTNCCKKTLNTSFSHNSFLLSCMFEYKL